MIRKFSFALVALLALPLVASASFTSSLDYTGLQNKVTFDTYYAVYRGGSVVASPANYQTGDVLLTLYSASKLEVQTAPNSASFNQVWTRPNSGSDYVVGYSAATIRPGGGLVNVGTDPAGLISGNFMSLYSNTSNYSVGAASAFTDIAATVSGGTQLALLGIANPMADYGVLSPSVGAVAPVNKYYALTNNGGSLSFDPGAISGSDLAGVGMIIGAPIFGGVGQWFSGGVEVASFALVPEPGTIALWGAGLAIGAVVAFRRRKQS